MLNNYPEYYGIFCTTTVTYIVEGYIWEHTLCCDLGFLDSGHFETGHLVHKLLCGVRDDLEHGTKVTHVGTIDHDGGVY